MYAQLNLKVIPIGAKKKSSKKASMNEHYILVNPQKIRGCYFFKPIFKRITSTLYGYFVSFDILNFGEMVSSTMPKIV
jgi:hypothetical protein